MGVHDGHRERVKSKFAEQDLTGFADHEALELLLFYAIPRRDTNELAHALISRFGSLRGVFEADIHELSQVEGIGENTALLIHLIPQLSKKALGSAKSGQKQLRDSRDMFQFLRTYYLFESTESAYVLCLDSQLRPIQCELLNRGVVNSVDVCVRKVVETALKYKAVQVVLSHNHPDSIAKPSADDIHLTKRVGQALATVEIKLIDHIIVSDDAYASFADMGLL